MKYIMTSERFISPLLWVHLSNTPHFLKPLIDSGSTCFIFLNCLIFQNLYTSMWYIHIYTHTYTCTYIYIIYIYLYILYIYIYILYIYYALLNFYHQGYIVCNLFFFLIFHFFIVYIIYKNICIRYNWINLMVQFMLSLTNQILVNYWSFFGFVLSFVSR